MKTDAIEIAIVSVNVTETVIDVVIDLDHTIASVQQVRVAVVIIIDVLDHHWIAIVRGEVVIVQEIDIEIVVDRIEARVVCPHRR